MSSVSHPTTTAPSSWNTSEHHGPAVSVVTWLLIIAVVLSVVARTVTRYAIIHSLRWDDITALLAMVVAIGQSIAVSRESTNGLGSHAASLSAAQISRFQKSHYANSLLYITALGLVKISVCLHVYGLSPVRVQRTASLAVGCFCALWALTSFIVIAFQCKLPHTWEVVSGGKCIHELAFWTYFGTLNMLTDLALIVLPVPIVLKLQISGGKKAVIMSCYALRFLVIAAVIVQLYFLQRDTGGSRDWIYDLWIPVLCAQVVVAFSIISGCFPFLKFLIDALETGMVRADARIGATQKLGSSGEGGPYFKAQGSRFRQGPSFGGAGVATPSKKTSQVQHSDVLRMQSLHGGMGGLHGAAGGNQGNHNQLQNTATKGSRGDDDIDSQSSQTHIIKKVEWTLTEGNADTSRV